MFSARIIPFALVVVFMLLAKTSESQDIKPKRNLKLYFHWGYNRAVYHTSDIHYSGGKEFDFTLDNVVAADAPDKFNSSYYNPLKFTIPQFNFRAGVVIDDRWSISGGWDHLKYRLRGGQTVKISGYIGENSGGSYAGNYENQDIPLDFQFLRMEHTDGLNFIHVNLDRHFTLFRTRNDLVKGEILVGVGTGPVCPWTDTRLFDTFYRNPSIHFAGWGASINATPRFTFGKYFFTEFMVRAGYIDLWDIMIERNRSKAQQKIGYFERNITAGFIFPL
jgi:hypothetical protein